MSGSKRQHGFTLVELLVVIATIALLVSLLLPVLAQAKQASYNVICQSNTHQVSVGSFSAAADYKQHFPAVQSGAYACIGAVELSGQLPGPSIDPDIDPGIVLPGIPFYREYMHAEFIAKPDGTYSVPPVLVCPGIPVNTPQVCMRMYEAAPPPPVYRRIGDTIGGWYSSACIVGMGSFLGQEWDTDQVPSAGNGMINGLTIRTEQFRVPSEETIFLDLLQGAGTGTSFTGMIAWKIPHGQDTPWGTNQGYADGSVRWSGWTECNYAYVPAYNWDRQILTAYHANPAYTTGSASLFNTGGYPIQNNYVYPPHGFVGINRIQCSAFDPNS